MKNIILLVILLSQLSFTQVILNQRRAQVINPPSAGGFTPSDLGFTFEFIWDQDSSVISGSETVYSITSGGYTFIDDTADALGKIVNTDSSFWFGYEAGVKELKWTDTGDNPFDFGLSDITVEAWIYYSGNGKTGRIFEKYSGINPTWNFSLVGSDGVVMPRFSMLNASQDSAYRLGLNTQVDSLESGWHQIIFAIERSGTGVMYIDSVLQTNSEVVGTALANFVNLNMANGGEGIIGQVGLGNLATFRLYPSLINAIGVKNLYEYGVSNGHR